MIRACCRTPLLLKYFRHVGSVCTRVHAMRPCVGLDHVINLCGTAARPQVRFRFCNQINPFRVPVAYCALCNPYVYACMCINSMDVCYSAYVFVSAGRVSMLFGGVSMVLSKL